MHRRLGDVSLAAIVCKISTGNVEALYETRRRARHQKFVRVDFSRDCSVSAVVTVVIFSKFSITVSVSYFEFVTIHRPE